MIGYRTGHPEFPHQTTADQWFAEAQFESYRRLGYHVADNTRAAVREHPDERERFFVALESIWYPLSERVDDAVPDIHWPTSG